MMLTLVVLIAVLGTTLGQLGGDKDDHGCLGSAGYQWCASLMRCTREWETPCPDDDYSDSDYAEENDETYNDYSDENEESYDEDSELLGAYQDDEDYSTTDLSQRVGRFRTFITQPVDRFSGSRRGTRRGRSLSRRRRYRGRNYPSQPYNRYRRRRPRGLKTLRHKGGATEGWNWKKKFAPMSYKPKVCKPGFTMYKGVCKPLSQTPCGC
jgi:hypothetical protein